MCIHDIDTEMMLQRISLLAGVASAQDRTAMLRQAAAVIERLQERIAIERRRRLTAEEQIEALLLMSPSIRAEEIQ